MISVIEMFSGIGAFRKALERQAVEHEVIGISEIDKYAIQSYNAIFGQTKNYGDISKVLKLDYADMWTYGFPCQDISVAGKQAGIKRDTRSGLLYQVQRLLETAYQYNELPKYLIMENVKNLVSKKFKADFDSWLDYLDEIGYNNYWQVLNAKDYGIPQNRERVFCISIRKDIDKGEFKFPEKQELRLRLKNVLEDEVEEKYYLSEKMIQGFLKHNENHTQKGTGFIWKPKIVEDIANCLRANASLAPTDNTIKCMQVGTLDIKGQDIIKRVYSSDGLSPTLTTMEGGNRQPKIVASRGRYNEDGTTEQHFEVQENGLTNTITTVQKDNYLLEPKIEKVDIPQIKSKCKRLASLVEKTTFEEGQVLNMDLYNQTTNEDISQCLTEPHHNTQRLFDGYRIRKLTPKECWRLMGFDDSDFDKAQASGVSNTQLYKQAGNSIVVNV